LGGVGRNSSLPYLDIKNVETNHIYGKSGPSTVFAGSEALGTYNGGGLRGVGCRYILSGRYNPRNGLSNISCVDPGDSSKFQEYHFGDGQGHGSLDDLRWKLPGTGIPHPIEGYNPEGPCAFLVQYDGINPALLPVDAWSTEVNSSFSPMQAGPAQRGAVGREEKSYRIAKSHFEQVFCFNSGYGRTTAGFLSNYMTTTADQEVGTGAAIQGDGLGAEEEDVAGEGDVTAALTMDQDHVNNEMKGVYGDAADEVLRNKLIKADQERLESTATAEIRPHIEHGELVANDASPPDGPELKSVEDEN
jgi:hypothetical protein